MKNNFCEDGTFKEKLKACHKKEAESYGIPDWANVNCPHCDSNDLDLSSIRNITCRLNPRNLGDISVEVYCDKCGIMDNVYFRKQFSSLKEFAEILDKARDVDCEPVVEEDMYRLRYNNLTEKMEKENQENQEKS